MARANTLFGPVSCLVAVGLVLTNPSNVNAFREPGSRVELVPAGTEWILGHSGVRPRGVIAPLPDAFYAHNGDGVWHQRLTGPHGGFRRIWGSGIAVDPAVTNDAAAAQAMAEQFWRDNEYLLPRGTGAAQLVPFSNSEIHGMRIVGHHQTADGVRVLGTSNYVVTVAGRIVLIGARNLPIRDFDGTPQIGAAAAVEAAVELIGDLGVEAVPGEVELAVLTVVGDDTVTPKLVFAVDLRASFGRWTAYVDARSGEGFALRDERMFADATLQAHVHPRHAADMMTDEPLPHLSLTANSEDVTTDGDGSFSATGDPLDVTATLDGLYAHVTNTAGDDIQLSASIADGETHVWTDGAEFEQAQLDSYISMNVIRDHIRALVDDMEWLDMLQQINANVYDMDGDTSPDYCNAWTDFESLNFLREGDSGWGGGCYNTASNADIVMHEWGHVFHGYSSWMGVGSFDPAVSEGFADTTAITISHDSTVAPYFTMDGYSIRNVEPDKVWPYDENPDPHQTGLIIGGAMWDLRKLFVSDFGSALAHPMMDDIFVQVVRTTAEVPSLWEATLVADDDNGDLADGTPNFCNIYTSYDLHGLVSGALGRINIEHEPLTNVVDAGPPISVDAVVYVTSEECSTLGEVRLMYSTDDGESWESVPMDNPSGDDFHGEIPAQPIGTELLYRIEADEEESFDPATKPYNEAEPFYKVYVGPLVEIFCDDFEAGDGGWTHELVFGEDVEGADDWMWGTPKGTGGDPDGCYSGEYCWGNDLSPEEDWNGMYQNEKCNRATSPPFDLSEYDHVRLRFRRWLNVEDGYHDHARIRVNDEEVWHNYVSPGSWQDTHDTHHEDMEWIQFDLDVSEWAAGQAEVYFAFEIQADGGGMFGGWTFDDFCLYTREALPDDPDGGVPDGGPGMGQPKASSGCGCDTAGLGPEPSLLGLLVSAI